MAEGTDRGLVGKQLGVYKISGLLGVGGMGEVYRAEDIRLGRTVAVKVLPAELAQDKDRLHRFVREARAASALSHANVAHIYDIGQSGGWHFIAMEYVEGQSLAQKTSGQPLALGEILDIGIQAADALAEAHEKGITHRDIKSANLMITPKGQVKVLDFGLAKMTRPEGEAVGSDVSTSLHTATGMVVGTLGYMSPEQVLGKDLDALTDLFSLGVVLYEMTTGRLPFSGSQANEVMDRILHGQPEAVARFNYDVPAELERIIRKCLEKDRERRYQFAREVRADLSRLKEENTANTMETVDKSVDKPRARLGRPVAVATDEQPGEVVTRAKDVVIAKGVGHRTYVIGALLGVALLAVLSWLALEPTWKKAGPPRTRTLAVLPFHWLNSELTDEHVEIGLADTLITRLSNLRQLIVRPTSSVLEYQYAPQDLQKTGRKLRVELVLEGSLRRVDNRIRATVRLINVRDGSTVWADKFDENWTDLLKVEDSIADRTVAELALRLSGEEKEGLKGHGTSNLDAYKLFAKARFFWNRRTEADLKLAIEYFEQAIAKDPNYGLAHVGVADAYVLLASMGGTPPREAYPKANAAITRALRLNDRLGEAHVTLGHIKVQYDWDRPAAETEYRRALELSPNYSPAHLYYAIFLKTSKREPEAMVEVERALELDPVSPILNATKGGILYEFRRTSQAVQQLRHAIELEPHFWFSHFWLALAYAHENRNEEALEEARKATDLSNGTHPWLLGYVQGVCGQRLEAEKSLRNLLTLSGQRHVPPYDIALIHLGLARKEEALEWLERGYQERSRWMDTLSVSPLFDPLRSDPRFQDLLRRLGLPQ